MIRHVLFMTFTEMARQRYLPHSAREALTAIFQPVLRDIIVFDFYRYEEGYLSRIT